MKLTVENHPADTVNPPYPKGRLFWIGIGLMAGSFGIFPFYFVIPFLPVSFKAKASLAIAAWVLNWGMFFVGTLFAGKEGYPFLKQLVRSRFRKS